MAGISGMAIVCVVGLIVIRGSLKGCDIYNAFLNGAAKGMQTAVHLLPALCGMLLLLRMMYASGLTELLTRLLSPLTGLMHLPQEVTALLILRPLSGSGSLAALKTIFDQCGPDSRVGTIASIMMGSSETILYTMTVYLSAAGVRRVPGAMTISLISYLIGVFLCGILIA